MRVSRTPSLEGNWRTGAPSTGPKRTVLNGLPAIRLAVRPEQAPEPGPLVAVPTARLVGVNVYLETDRMLLRQFTADDLDFIMDLDSDPAVKRYIDNGAPVDSAESQEMLESWLGYHERGEEYGFFAAIERSSGEFLGWFHFRPGDDAGPLEPELGYRLRRAAWGRELGTEGSRALIDKGFTELHVERVYATTMAVNLASRRVMEKSGLRYVRTFHADWPVRIPGDEAGDVEYALSSAEWETATVGRPRRRTRPFLTWSVCPAVRSHAWISTITLPTWVSFAVRVGDGRPPFVNPLAESGPNTPWTRR